MNIDISGNISRPYLEAGVRGAGSVSQKGYRPTPPNIIYVIFGTILSVILFFFAFYLPYKYLNLKNEIKDAYTSSKNTNVPNAEKIKFVNGVAFEERVAEDQINSYLKDEIAVSLGKRSYIVNILGVSLSCLLWVAAILLSIVSMYEADLEKKKSYTEKAKNIAIAGGVIAGTALIHVIVLMLNDDREKILTNVNESQLMSRFRRMSQSK